ncbi:DUF3515 domain-containing protein [Cellulomonas sp. zg-ZUI188]|uniref:DUF3515 domain-containing protein n=1 Tax=Cellulomonas fengjieae TaxID=2819978 RepID=A0ABS3SDU4_9CELL|nr:DUF3515 domain-containing protein [Cellulomonas fengjieae]MBO3101338.1 DUF3515 domain-containing protein [Cellulomonas fengjieae]QVI67929.1 DUF3515 domain-containing protein [Cellulomonas fengjieae]
MRRRLQLITPVAGLLALGGCAAAVPAQVAPHATDPVCASVVLAAPESLGEGLPRRDTNAQATTAWGDTSAPVVLRCGVEPPGPTTERCESVETPGGVRVDWIVVEGDDGWTFTTYGREPAVELHVPAQVAAERSTAFVDQLGSAVSLTEQLRSCV